MLLRMRVLLAQGHAASAHFAISSSSSKSCMTHGRRSTSASMTPERRSTVRGVFIAALTADGHELSPVRRLGIERAAQATALAEMARSRYMRDGDGDLDDLIRAERRADTLIKWLGCRRSSRRRKRHRCMSTSLRPVRPTRLLTRNCLTRNCLRRVVAHNPLGRHNAAGDADDAPGAVGPGIAWRGAGG